MKQARPDPDYRPSIKDMSQWEEEWNNSDRKQSLQWFIMEKTADHAAKIERDIWSKVLDGYGHRAACTLLMRERNPPPPKPYLYQDGYIYKLDEDETLMTDLSLRNE